MIRIAATCRLLLAVAPASAQPAPTPTPPATPAPPPSPAAGDATAPTDGATTTPPPDATAPDGTAPDSATADDDLAAELGDAIAADTATAAKNAPAGGGGALQSLNPDLAFIADLALAWFSQDQNLQAGDHDPHDNGFQLTGLELSVGKEVDPYFRFDANLVFGADGVEIEEAYGTTLDLPYSLQARAGQFLTRFGRMNNTHPHQWDFADQPFALSRVFGGEGNRGPGVELSWLTPLSWYVEVIGSVTDARGEGTARSFIGDAGRPVDSPVALQDTLAVKSFHELSPDLSLLWGASYATGPSGARKGDRADVVGVDAYLKYRPITRQSHTIIALTTEWIARRRQQPDATLTDVSGYAQLFWRFAQRWGTAVRYDYGGAATDADGATGADALDPDWTSARHRGTAALTFWPSEFSRLRAQISVDRPGWLDDPVVAGFLTLELAVGAHGAHAF